MILETPLVFTFRNIIFNYVMFLSSDQMNYNKAFKSRQVKDALLNMKREKDVELIGLRMRTAPTPFATGEEYLVYT